MHAQHWMYFFPPSSVDTLGVLTVGEKQLMLRSLKRAGVNGQIVAIYSLSKASKCISTAQAR